MRTRRLNLHIGEKPEPLENTVTTADGTLIDLNGYTATATWQHSDGTSGTLAGVVDGSAGKVTVTVTATVTASSGVVDLLVWAGNGTLLYPCGSWRLLIADPPGTAPAI